MTEGSCKLCRVLSEWDVERYEDRLLRDWQGKNGPRKGYRTLAREINVMLLRREMDRAGVTTLANEASSKYDRLTGEDETIARETRRLLRNEGVPIESLTSDFVSYGTVRTHLTSCLDAEYDPPDSSGRWTTESIDIATENAQQKIEEAVNALVNRDELHVGGDVSVGLDVTLTCSVCDARVDVDRAIRRGYVCSCTDNQEMVESQQLSE